MKNFNYVKSFKYFVIIALVIVVAGLAMLGFLNLNKSTDYAGATEIQISASEVFDNDSSVISKTAKDVFSKNGLNYNSVKSMDENRIVIYEFTSAVSDAVVTELENALNSAELSASIDVEVEKFSTVSYKTFEDSWWLILAAGILLVAAFIYLAFRYKWASAFATLVSSLAYVLVAIALTAITRIPVTTAYTSALVFGFVLNLATAVYNLSAMKEYGKNVATANDDASEFANYAFKSNFMKNIFTLCAIIIAAVALLILGGSFVKYAALAIIVCSVAAVYVSVALFGGIYATFKQIK